MVGGAIAWRLPFAVHIPPAIIISTLLSRLPEIPRWFMEHDRVDKVVEITCKVYGAPPDDEYFANEKRGILEALQIGRQSPFSWANVYKRDCVYTGWRIILTCLGLSSNQVRARFLLLCQEHYRKLMGNSGLA